MYPKVAVFLVVVVFMLIRITAKGIYISEFNFFRQVLEENEKDLDILESKLEKVMCILGFLSSVERIIKFSIFFVFPLIHNLTRYLILFVLITSVIFYAKSCRKINYV